MATDRWQDALVLLAKALEARLPGWDWEPADRALPTVSGQYLHHGGLNRVDVSLGHDCVLVGIEQSVEFEIILRVVDLPTDNSRTIGAVADHVAKAMKGVA